MLFVGTIKSIDSSRMGLVGASYSGEAVGVASRSSVKVHAIVALSPGSLSDESIGGIDSSRVPWLIIVSRDEKHLKQVFTELAARSHTAETIEMSGTAHATDLLETHPELNAMIAAWVTAKLSSGRCKEDAHPLER
jgi:dienelactone hydrolase